MKIRWTCTIAALLFAMLAAAQPPRGPEPGKPGRPGRDGWRGGAAPEVRALLEEVMMARLSRRLQLSDEETVLLVRQFSRYRERMRQMRQERRDLLRALEKKVKTGADDTQVLGALAALREHDQAMAGLQQKVFDEVAKHLRAEQQAKLYVFLGDFEEEVQRLIQQARERFRSGQIPPGRQGRMGMRGPGQGAPPANSPGRRRPARRSGGQPKAGPTDNKGAPSGVQEE